MPSLQKGFKLLLNAENWEDFTRILGINFVVIGDKSSTLRPPSYINFNTLLKYHPFPLANEELKSLREGFKK